MKIESLNKFTDLVVFHQSSYWDLTVENLKIPLIEETKVTPYGHTKPLGGFWCTESKEWLDYLSKNWDIADRKMSYYTYRVYLKNLSRILFIENEDDLHRALVEFPGPYLQAVNLDYIGIAESGRYNGIYIGEQVLNIFSDPSKEICFYNWDIPSLIMFNKNNIADIVEIHTMVNEDIELEALDKRELPWDEVE